MTEGILGQTTRLHDGYLKGKLLLAAPSMGDTRFERAVIFMCEHNQNGAMGLVINHVMPDVVFDDLMKQLTIKSDITVDVRQKDIKVLCGGPMENARGFMLHSSDFNRKDTTRITPEYGVSATVESLKDMMCEHGPENMLFILGYAGWGPGQLDIELQENSWMVVDPDKALIFENPVEEKWMRAVKKLGIDPFMLSSTAGRA